MFFHILKKDLKRKKTMNIILLIFIILATMFLASSVDNLMAVNGAIDHFLGISKVSDFLAIVLSDGKEDKIARFLQDNENISEYEVIDTFNLVNEDIKITSCKEEPGKSRYERTNTLCVGMVPENFMKVFKEDDSALSLNPGEIALPKVEADNNNLQVGDKILIKLGEIEQEFEIAAVVKDAVFGSPMMGFKRMFISKADFEKFKKQENLTYTQIYCVNYINKEDFKNDWRSQNLITISSLEGEGVIRMCYIMDMLIAVILIVVSVCLILLAFLVLRFTIVFTIQEDYREIGIMKAIGIQDMGIKGVYLIKYLAISVIGAFAGFILSFPFGKMILKQAIVNIVVDRAEQNFVVNIVCAVAIVGIVLTFCYLSTNKLKKISAMEAIRSGSNGERYKAKNYLKLWKQAQMRPYLYMAVNDILSSLKRFGVLLATFCLGVMLILLPLSPANTLKSDGIIREFSLSPSDVYIDTGKGETYTVDMDSMFGDMDEIERKLEENGMNARTGVDMGYQMTCYAGEPENNIVCFVLQEMGSWERSYAVLSGKEPELSNEIMITQISADELGVGIGDTMHCMASDTTYEFIITGIYQSMMEMGKGCRISRNADINREYAGGIICMQVEIEDMESEEACERLEEIFPEYKIMNAQEFLSNMIGGVIDQLGTLMVFIVGIVLVINSLITILIMKTIMTKERGDIALLKSLGFTDISLRAWQVARVLIILAAAIIIGTVLTNISAPYIIGPVFAMMGATSIELVNATLKDYIFYPLLLFIVTGICAMICAGGVSKVDLKEINSME